MCSKLKLGTSKKVFVNEKHKRDLVSIIRFIGLKRSLFLEI